MLAKRKNKDIPVEIIDMDDYRPAESQELVEDNSELYSVDMSEQGRLRVRGRIRGRVAITAIALLCAYLVFLIIGVISTDYYVTDEQTNMPVIAGYQTLQAREDYKEIKKNMTEIREIMRDMTIIDIKVANEDISYNEAAVQYTQLLNDKIDVLIPKIQAMDLTDGNALIQQEMESLLANDIAIYLQKISAGLQASDASAVQTALAWRESAFTSYDTLSEHITALAQAIKQEDDPYLQWDLNEAVLEKDPSAVLK